MTALPASLRSVSIFLCAIACATPAAAQSRQGERTNFTDAEIVDGFLQTTIGAELQVAGRTDRIRKYGGPVRVYIESRGRPDRRRTVQRVVADIARRVRNIDLAVTTKRDDANFTVTLVRSRQFYPTLTRLFGRDRAQEIRRDLDPQCLSGFRKGDDYRIIGSTVVLMTDVSDFVFADCAYEELLQALGPINDTDKVPWTMFNDDVQRGYFNVYDQYIMNILYDPRVKPGMTADEVQQVLPQVLPDVRTFVAERNRLPR